MILFEEFNPPFQSSKHLLQENMQRQMESSQEAIAQRMDFSQVRFTDPIQGGIPVRKINNPPKMDDLFHGKCYLEMDEN